MQFAMKASPAPRRCGSVTYRAEPFPWCGRSRTHAHRSQREDHHPRTLSFRFCSSECIFVALSARNAVMSSGARRLHSPVEACHRLQIGQPLRRSPQWSWRAAPSPPPVPVSPSLFAKRSAGTEKPRVSQGIRGFSSGSSTEFFRCRSITRSADAWPKLQTIGKDRAEFVLGGQARRDGEEVAGGSRRA
jgi:hypothetical protein